MDRRRGNRTFKEKKDYIMKISEKQILLLIDVLKDSLKNDDFTNFHLNIAQRHSLYAELINSSSNDQIEVKVIKTDSSIN